MSDGEFSAGGYRIAVTSETKLHARTEMELSDLEGRDVVVSIRREADDTLTALQIIYLYRLRARDQTAMRSMLLAK